jgi:hypothetical protein
MKKKFDSKITFHPEEIPHGVKLEDFIVFPMDVLRKPVSIKGKNGGVMRWEEQVEEKQATFYSVFAHIPGQGLVCIADCNNKNTAETLRNILQTTGMFFKRK